MTHPASPFDTPATGLRAVAQDLAPDQVADDGLSHFDPSVPLDLRRKLLAIAEAVREDFLDDYCSGGRHGCDRIDPLHGTWTPGFIPSQDGGFEVSDFTQNHGDSSYDIHPDQNEHYNESYPDMLRAFASDHLNLEWDGAKEWARGYFDGTNDIPEDLRETFWDYETEWFSEALLRFEIWCDRGPEERIYWRLSANFSDAPYYRSSYDRTICEGTLTRRSVLGCEPETFLKLLSKKADAAWKSSVKMKEAEAW